MAHAGGLANEMGEKGGEDQWRRGGREEVGNAGLGRKSLAEIKRLTSKNCRRTYLVLGFARRLARARDLKMSILRNGLMMTRKGFNNAHLRSPPKVIKNGEENQHAVSASTVGGFSVGLWRLLGCW
jgi:hypothetical protein